MLSAYDAPSYRPVANNNMLAHSAEDGFHSARNRKSLQIDPKPLAARVKNRNSSASGGLNQSTYQRNSNAFSVIQNDLASGASVMGRNEKT